MITAASGLQRVGQRFKPLASTRIELLGGDEDPVDRVMSDEFGELPNALACSAVMLSSM